MVEQDSGFPFVSYGLNAKFGRPDLMSRRFRGSRGAFFQMLDGSAPFVAQMDE
jgi:hypothetical protein